MPRYIVSERRGRRVEYLVEAESAEAAGKLEGEIIDEGGDADDFGEELLSVELVDDDTEML